MSKKTTNKALRFSLRKGSKGLVSVAVASFIIGASGTALVNAEDNAVTPSTVQAGDNQGKDAEKENPAPSNEEKQAPKDEAKPSKDEVKPENVSKDDAASGDKGDQKKPESNTGAQEGNNAGNNQTGSQASDPAAKVGQLVIHHVYKTYEQGADGNKKLVDTKTETVIEEGSAQLAFSAKKAEKDGFKFTTLEDGKNLDDAQWETKKESGELTGNFLAGQTREITFVYEKVAKAEGAETGKGDKASGEVDKKPEGDKKQDITAIIDANKPEKAKTPKKAESVKDLLEADKTTDQNAKKDVAKGESTAEPMKDSNKDNKQASKKLLPDTGEAENKVLFSTAALAILAGLGLVASNRKQENE